MLFNYLNFQFSKSWRFWDSFSLACWAIRSSLVPLYPMLISIMPLSWCSGGLCPKLVAGPSAQKNYFFLDPLAVFLGAASSKISDLAFLTRFQRSRFSFLGFLLRIIVPFFVLLTLILILLSLSLWRWAQPQQVHLWCSSAMWLCQVAALDGAEGIEEGLWNEAVSD